IGGAGSTDNLTSVSVGGTDGSSGNGSAVDVTLGRGSIQTSGGAGHGIIAQSIGGGGGIAGALEDFYQIGRSGTSNGSGNGGNVSIKSGAQIIANGSNAVGIIAQSIGGGGGLLGLSGLSQMGAGTSGTGSSGDVTITQNALISATGHHAIGILAQS